MSGRPRAIVSDFGGVLTTPLMQSFLAVQDQFGIAPEQLGRALGAAVEETGVNPLFEMECGRLSEADFLDDLSRRLLPELGRFPDLHRFREIYFDALEPNEPMLSLMAELKGSGMRMALLTNNVREWEPLWRSMLPVDELFEFVVDSAFVGMRKPDPRIFALTIEGFGPGITAGDCLFLDDMLDNVEAARMVGLRAVHYREPEQAIAEVRDAV